MKELVHIVFSPQLFKLNGFPLQFGLQTVICDAALHHTSNNQHVCAETLHTSYISCSLVSFWLHMTGAEARCSLRVPRLCQSYQ